MTDHGALGRDIMICGLTHKRRRDQNTYCMRLHPVMRRKLGLGDQCVITAKPAGDPEFEGLVRPEDAVASPDLADFVGLSPPQGRRRVIARVLSSRKTARNCIEIDETIRTALAMHMDETCATEKFEVEVRPLRTPLFWGLRDALTRVVGYRHMYARVGVGFVADIDKPIGRVPEFAFPLLGIDDGGAVVCETVERRGRAYRLRETPLRIYRMTGDILAERARKEADPAQRRFRSSSALLGLTNELPHLFIGLDMRDRLDCGDLDAVRVRRRVGNVLLEEAVNFGLVASLSSLAVVQTLLALDVPLVAGLIAAGVFSLLLPLLLIVIRARGAIY